VPKSVIRNVVAIALLALAATACSRDAPSVACEYGTNAAREGKYDEAVKLISTCLASAGVSDTLRADALKARAWSYSNLSQHALAVDDQEKAFKLRPPANYLEFINYASYLRRVGRYQDSLDAVLAAERIEAGKVSMMTQYNKGWSLLELRRYKDAVDAFSKGVPGQPDFAFVYWRRGLAYEALGERQLAERDFEQCAELLINQNKVATAGELLPAMREKLRQYGLDKRLSF
jgi:tetratricopeptide (TPR) repeat protein